MNLPSLGAGLAWDTSGLLVDGTLGVILEGDFDSDGDIDVADLIVWQRGGSPDPFSASDLAIWQAAFGSGSAKSSAAQTVPEPSSLLLLLAYLAGGSCCRHRFSTPSFNRFLGIRD